MTTPQHRPPLAALAAAVFALSLAACGGGGGEAPPDRPGSVVAPAAPVVTITNNVTAETATGPITFTFSFNRDVGTSFQSIGLDNIKFVTVPWQYSPVDPNRVKGLLTEDESA